MDISSCFALADFLAFLFPSIFTLSGGYFIVLLLLPVNSSFANFSPDLTTGIFFLVFSYIVGVLVAGVAEISVNWLRHKKNDNNIPLPGFEAEIKDAFEKVFGGEKIVKWARIHFYLCRSLVFEYMPNALRSIERQNSLRQLRVNIVPSILIWACAGIGWGWRISSQGMTLWGTILIIVSLISSLSLLAITLNRMQNNDQREIRETLTAFLAGYKIGLFDKHKHSDSKKLS